MNSHGDLKRLEEVSLMPRKRKVRKGTQSCWECKRRKTRCIFVPADSVCVGCKSRDTKCLSQEFDEDISATRPKATTNPVRNRMASPAARPAQHNGKRIRTSVPASMNPLYMRNCPSPEAAIPSGKYYDIYFALTAVWPCDHDLNLAYSVAVKNPNILRGPLYSPFSEPVYQEELLPHEVLRPTPPGSHPVLIARKLLLLSVLFQYLPSHGSEDTFRLHGVTIQILNTVNTLVTTNDELIYFIEGIECIALESMIHNNRGNLRRALLSTRKAMVLAQLMGLHRQEQPLWLEVIESQTRTRIDFNYIWFRLVESDRYLSLMLGVPQAWADNSFLERKQSELCSSMERLERLLLIIGGRILDRGERDMRDFAVTGDIDQLLQRSAACMPPQWWLFPSLSSKWDKDPTQTRRIMFQFTHLFLLTQLHFPYLLHPSNEHPYTYSQVTAANASRDILRRFIAFRDNEAITSYCRGIDFIAFLASVALCLVHIVGRCRQQTSLDKSDGYAAPYYLIHQRASDRGLLERLLEHMERTMHSSDDTIASKVVVLLRPLLAMEACSTSGTILTASFSAEANCKGPEYSGQVSNCGSVISISIPHCGEVHLANPTFDIETLPSFDSLFDQNMDCINPTWLSEETSGTGSFNINEAVTQAPEGFTSGSVEENESMRQEEAAPAITVDFA